MIFREAVTNEIPQMMDIRLAVKENTLSDPTLVSYNDMLEYLTIRGKGWVCDINDTIIGFVIADLKTNSVWALFVHPQAEGKGIGKKLQALMLDWYFSKTSQAIWLETDADTRAERFYRSTGWKETGRLIKQPKNPSFPPFTEIKFEITADDWNKYRA